MATTDDGAFWTIIAYLIAGLGFWGGMGFLADLFFKTNFLTVLGMFLGMAIGLYLIWIRFIKESSK